MGRGEMRDTNVRVRSCEVEKGVRRGLQKRARFSAPPSFLSATRAKGCSWRVQLSAERLLVGSLEGFASFSFSGCVTAFSIRVWHEDDAVRIECPSFALYLFLVLEAPLATVRTLPRFRVVRARPCPVPEVGIRGSRNRLRGLLPTQRTPQKQSD